jgi:hypothetical protein
VNILSSWARNIRFVPGADVDMLCGFERLMDEASKSDTKSYTNFFDKNVLSFIERKIGFEENFRKLKVLEQGSKN